MKSIPWHSIGRLALNGGAFLYTASAYLLQGGVHLSPQATAIAGAVVLLGNLTMHGPVTAPASTDTASTSSDASNQ